MSRFWIAAAISVGLAAPAALAQEAIPKRQKNQQERIAKGAASGELSKQEVKKLEKEQARNKADGDRMTGKKKAKIHRKQNQASKHIPKKKHAKQKRK